MGVNEAKAQRKGVREGELQQDAVFLRGCRHLFYQRCPGGMLEDFLHPVPCLRRALEVLVGIDLLCGSQAVIVGDGLLKVLLQVLRCPRVVSEVLLQPNQQHWQVLAEVSDLGDPAVVHV